MLAAESSDRWILDLKQYLERRQQKVAYVCMLYKTVISFK